jgi:hypothetical protein
MQKLNFQRRAAARSAEPFEMCPPRVFRGPSRGLMVPAHGVCLRQYHEFDNLGGKPNETNDTLIDLRFGFCWHRPECFLGNGG